MPAENRRPGWLSRAAVKGFGVPISTIPVPDDIPPFTDHRRRVALAMLRDKAPRPEWTALPTEARLMFAVGLIICGEAGFIAERDLVLACTRPDLLVFAEGLLKEAGACG